MSVLASLVVPSMYLTHVPHTCTSGQLTSSLTGMAPQGGGIMSLAACEDDQSVASGSSTGSIHVWRVEYTTRAGGSAPDKYTGGVRGAAGDHVIWLGVMRLPLLIVLAQPWHSIRVTGHCAGRCALPGCTWHSLPLKPASPGPLEWSVHAQDLSSSPSCRQQPTSSSLCRMCCCAGVVGRRQLPGSEGTVLQLQQWGSLLLYVTQQGGVHAWDLRMRGDAWLLRTQPSQGLAEQLVADPSGGWLEAWLRRQPWLQLRQRWAEHVL